MKWSRRRVECSRIDEDVASPTRTGHGELGEADVVADAQFNLGELCVQLVDEVLEGYPRRLP